MTRLVVQGSLVAVLVGVVAYFYFNHFVESGEPVFVNTVYGRLQGKTVQIRGGRRVNSFTSIPYAKPPIGDLRFEPPIPFGKWEEDVLDGTTPVRLCTQFDNLWKRLEGVEDCLQLHVYTPTIDKTKPPLPVMVWFHGGHFMYGGNNIYGPHYLLQEDIVLVTVNYRLNSLGFLNTGDDVVTGNQGLKDQALALKWIQSAIRDFGGDPNSVTLFGCSAGGASVNYHMISPMSKGLFHRGISQSASSLCPWGFTRDPKAQARRLAEKVNCGTGTSTELVKCLKSKSAEEIVNTHREIIDIFHDPQAIFGPSIEYADATEKAGNSVFLSDSPYKLYKTGQFSAVPWITGVTSEEGCFRSPQVTRNDSKLQEFNEKWTKVAPNALLLYNDDPSLSNKVRTFYFGKTSKTSADTETAKGLDFGKDDYQSITNLYSDRYFFGCVRDAAIFHAKSAPVHLYYYTYKHDISYGYIQEHTPGTIPVQLEVILAFLKFRLYNVLKWDLFDYGTCHTDDMQSLFLLNPLLAVDEKSPHYAFSRKMVKLWTNFARTGNAGSIDGVQWAPLRYDKENNKPQLPLRYLHLGGKVAEMTEEPFTDRLKFWEDLNLPRN